MKSRVVSIKKDLPLHLMLLPGLIIVLIYSYGPMVGLLMAFEKYIPSKGIFGSEWIGWDNFKYVLSIPDVYKVLWNTVFIAFLKIVANLVVPIVFALLLNEVVQKNFKRVIQTAVYLPYFLSWVILGGVIIDILSPSSGIINQVLQWIGIEPIFFLGDSKLFPYTLVVTDVWKNFGFGTIIYLAALTNIDPTQYESAVIDGANRLRQVWHITLPGMMPIIVLMATLSMGNILNAGFDQVFNLYSPIVYETGDVIDTYVYRMGLVDAQYSMATAVGLFQSVVSLLFVTVSYKLANKFADYKIF